MLTYIIVVVVVLIFNFAANYQKEKNKKKQNGVAQQRNPLIVSRERATMPLPPFSKRKPSVANIVDALEQTAQSTETLSQTRKPIIDYPSLENCYNSIDQYQTKSQLTDLNDLIILESDAEEKKAFDIDKKEERVNLDLDTNEDIKKAFLHSLIFDRKY